MGTCIVLTLSFVITPPYFLRNLNNNFLGRPLRLTGNDIFDMLFTSSLTMLTTMLIYASKITFQVSDNWRCLKPLKQVNSLATNMTGGQDMSSCWYEVAGVNQQWTICCEREQDSSMITMYAKWIITCGTHTLYQMPKQKYSVSHTN